MYGIAPKIIPSTYIATARALHSVASSIGYREAVSQILKRPAEAPLQDSFLLKLHEHARNKQARQQQQRISPAQIPKSPILSFRYALHSTKID